MAEQVYAHFPGNGHMRPFPQQNIFYVFLTKAFDKVPKRIYG